MLKRVWKFLSSMKFAIILLVILLLACAGGSFITQNQTFDWYKAAYSERIAAIIMALRLDDVYHSWWFLLIAAFLSGNLILCNLTRLKPLIRRYRDAGMPGRAEDADAKAEGLADPAPLFQKLRFPAPTEDQDEEGRKRRTAARNRIGLFGAWICHLGILLLIVGFTLGQLTHREYTVYGVPGQTKPIGDTGLMLEIDEFDVALRPDDTVEQYTVRFSVYDAADPGRRESAEASVNAPADLRGYRFYQNSTGWAARVRVRNGEELLQETVLCAGEALRIRGNESLLLFFSAFYPDYVLIPGEGPMTRSSALNNPAYLYQLYYNEDLLGMNVLTGGESIRVDSYEISFSEPQNYTLIQIKRDSFTWMALAGGLVVLIGLFLAFYLQQEKLTAVEEEDGTWTVYGYSRKNSVLFKERFDLSAQGILKGEPK